MPEVIGTDDAASGDRMIQHDEDTEEALARSRDLCIANALEYSLKIPSQ